MGTRFDQVLVDIADYVEDAAIERKEAYDMARLCLMDSLGCGLLALSDPACARFLGPIVPGTTAPQGARVPGTPFVLDPVEAAFNIGCLIRWLDLNDTWLAAEWGHPSDNLGGILAVADFVSRQNLQKNRPPLKIKSLLEALIKAYEIQGILALENSFNRIGLDHVLLVRVATAALATRMLGGRRAQILSALSNAWVDGGTLRLYRHAPNAGMRKSWAAGDATSRGVRLAFLALRGEPGYPSALSAQKWGFYEVFCKEKPFSLPRPYGSYVVENILFKPFPAEFHAQTAVECARLLHPRVRERLEEIEQIQITTQEPALRIIDKTGPLHNPADRDHCLQYMVAIALIFGEITPSHYQDAIAADPRIDRLRERMTVRGDPGFSQDYLDPAKRSIANALQIRFADGSMTERIVIEYPLGHPRRRTEAMPVLLAKFKANLTNRLPPERCQAILDLSSDPERFDETPVNHWVDGFILNP